MTGAITKEEKVDVVAEKGNEEQPRAESSYFGQLVESAQKLGVTELTLHGSDYAATAQASKEVQARNWSATLRLKAFEVKEEK